MGRSQSFSYWGGNMHMIDVPEGRRGASQWDSASGFFETYGQNNFFKTLPEQLAAKLVEDIIGGTFKPGQRLQETALAERFGVSRGPVREALRLLEVEHLVVMASHRGASVAVMTRKKLEDIFAMRSVVMGLCAREIARDPSFATQTILDEATRRLLAASHAGQVGEFVFLVYQASMFVAEASGNEVARSVLISLGRRTLSQTRLVFEHQEERQKWVANWQSITDAVRQGDADRAGGAVHRLIYGLFDSYIAQGVMPEA